MYLSIYLSIYLYIYIQRERERDLFYSLDAAIVWIQSIILQLTMFPLLVIYVVFYFTVTNDVTLSIIEHVSMVICKYTSRKDTQK